MGRPGQGLACRGYISTTHLAHPQNLFACRNAPHSCRSSLAALRHNPLHLLHAPDAACDRETGHSASQSSPKSSPAPNSKAARLQHNARMPGCCIRNASTHAKDALCQASAPCLASCSSLAPGFPRTWHCAKCAQPELPRGKHVDPAALQCARVSPRCPLLRKQNGPGTASRGCCCCQKLLRRMLPARSMHAVDLSSAGPRADEHKVVSQCG